MPSPVRATAVASVALALALGLAGCGSTHAVSDPTPTTTNGVSSASPGGGVAPGSNPTSTTPTTTPGTVPKTSGPLSDDCTTSQLSASFVAGSTTGDTTTDTIKLRNSSTISCSLAGYPRVAYVTQRSGRLIGAEATDLTGPLDAVLTLAPGHSARATLRVVSVGTYGDPSCEPVAAKGLSVSPPGDTTPLFVPLSATGCGNAGDPLLTVGPLTAAS